jgi:hypothetical protein
LLAGFPKLYFQDPETKMFEAVPNGGQYCYNISSFQQPTNCLFHIGLLGYYQNRGSLDKTNGGSGLKAFPPGFKTITGNTVKRSKQFPDTKVDKYEHEQLNYIRKSLVKNGKSNTRRRDPYHRRDLRTTGSLPFAKTK